MNILTAEIITPEELAEIKRKIITEKHITDLYNFIWKEIEIWLSDDNNTRSYIGVRYNKGDYIYNENISKTVEKMIQEKLGPDNYWVNDYKGLSNNKGVSRREIDYMHILLLSHKGKK